MGNLRMNADQISYKGGEKPMSVEQAIKNAGNTGLAHTADIAPDFSTESAYSAGDYVYHNGTLYVFTSNHAAGAWSTSDTQAVTVGGEIATLTSGLTNQTVPQIVTTVTLASGLSGTVACVKIGQLVLVSGYCSGTIAQNDEIIQNLPPYRTDFGIQYCRYPAILDGNITSPMLFTASNALSVVAACSSVNFFVMYVTN